MDLRVEGKQVVVFGGGEEAELKAVKLLDAGAKVTVVSKDFSRGLRKLGASGSVRLIQAESSEYGGLIKAYRPFVVFSAMGDDDLDRRMVFLAKSIGALVCAVDRPSLNDFNMPAVAKIGDIRVAISTGGLSPAMARVLRRRIERVVKPEDILQVKLQSHVKRIMRETIADQSARKRAVYRVLEDANIRSLLRRNRLEDAKVRAKTIIASIGSDRGSFS